MIDLHCHILPRIDDGAGSLTESLEMAAIAADHGIRHIVATPHCIDGGVTQVRECLSLLRRALEDARIPIRVYGGMEIFGTYDTAQLLLEGKLLTINRSRYPLIEFDFDTDGEQETQILQSVIDAGYIPLVAHPERYGCVCSAPELANLWKRMGCLFQINRGSLLGRYGQTVQETAMELVRRGFAAAVATDAHTPVVRTPRAADVYELLEQAVSPLAAQILMKQNPKRILLNRTLPEAEPDWCE